jgi:hypothetical protein
VGSVVSSGSFRETLINLTLRQAFNFCRLHHAVAFAASAFPFLVSHFITKLKGKEALKNARLHFSVLT